MEFAEISAYRTSSFSSYTKWDHTVICSFLAVQLLDFMQPPELLRELSFPKSGQPAYLFTHLIKPDRRNYILKREKEKKKKNLWKK